MIAFEGVEKALRQRTFGTLSTLTEQGAPHATGVVYAVSARDVPLILYVTTRTTTRKVRNIRAHADIAFVVPVPRRFLPVFPPRAIQFQGTATVVSAEDEEAAQAFSSSWLLRRILATEQRIVTEGGDLCFIRIRPERMLFTYGMGMSVLDNLRHPRAAIGRVAIPAGR
jgi:uncharacterized protein YhbP (UPF0306 family)